MMLKPMRMKKLVATIYEDYVDEVIYALGRLGIAHLIDIREDLDSWKGLIEPVEPGDRLFKCMELLSRVERLMDELKMSEKSYPAEPLRGDFNKIIDDSEIELDALENNYRKLKTEVESLMEKKVSDEEKPLLESTIVAKKIEFEQHLQLFKKSLLVIRSRLEALRKVDEAKRLLGRTHRTYVMEAWVPLDKVEDARKAIVDTSKGLCIVEFPSPPTEAHATRVPVAYRIPTFLKPFEKLVNAYGIPLFNEINPTVITFITFPLIFGIMFADAGHASVMAVCGLLFILLRRRMEKAGAELTGITGMVLSAGELLLLCGLSGIFWGILFGEIFSQHEFLGIHLHPLELLRIGREVRLGGFVPYEDVMAMFHLAIFIGVCQINLGLILSLVNKVANREFKEAASIACWIWFYDGAAYVVLAYGSTVAFNFSFWLSNPHLLFAPLAALIVLEVVSRGMEGFSHGLMVFVESLSHTVSYGRLLALNLVHVSVGKMFLQMQSGILGVTLGTLISLILEGTIIFVHTLRLHWVEWFSKFYSGGGVKYIPFKI